MRHALAAVRAELGLDAIIVRTRQRSSRNLLVQKVTTVEITAARDELAAKEAVAEEPSPLPQVEVAPPSPRADFEHRLERLAARLKEVEAQRGEQRTVTPLEEYLRAIELDEEVLDGCLKVAAKASRELQPDDFELMDAVVAHLATLLPCQPGFPDQTHVAALVGPTGVGKTSMIAKLAAQALEPPGRWVSLVSLDSRRIGAAAELRRYAEILGTGWMHARSPKDLEEYLSRQPAGGLILIDTPGFSAIDRVAIESLRRYFGSGVEVLLVLAANIRGSSARAALDAFSVLDYGRLIFTKLDETPGTGAIAVLAVAGGTPIACVGLGQGVPGDWEPARSVSLARWALGEAARRVEEPMFVRAA